MTLLRLLMSAHIAAGEGNVLSPCQKAVGGVVTKSELHSRQFQTDRQFQKLFVEIHMHDFVLL